MRWDGPSLFEAVKKRLIAGRMAGYSQEQLQKDIVAGITVGLVAIPLALAFAIASGVKPEQGIYTAVVAGALIALFGGSHVQIGGPTGAFVPLLFSIVVTYGYENLMIAGAMAGLILIFMGMTRMGALIKFIPRPVTVGFTAGIAVIIFFGQIDTFLGLQGVVKHKEFLDNVAELGRHLDTVQWQSISVALVCLICLLYSPKILPAVPSPLVGIVVSTIFAQAAFGGAVETIGAKFGELSAGWPAFQWPAFNLEKAQQMLGPALTIAALGSIESLLSCVVADGMTGKRHDSNRELIGQGIANLIVPFFGGIPATGAIARTATNIRSGGGTPIAALVHSLTVFLLVLLFAPFVSQVPLVSMSPILMRVAWNMSDRREFAHLLRTTRSDAIVLLVTFGMTVVFDLTVAVGAGMVIAAAVFINNMSQSLAVQKVLPDPQQGEKLAPEAVTPIHDCPHIAIYTIDGALFFGAASLFEKTLSECINARPKVLILRMGHVPMMDATGEMVFEEIVRAFRKRGGIVLVTGLKPQPEALLRTSGLYDQIGEAHVFQRTGQAITFALTRIGLQRCAGCPHQAFHECEERSTASMVGSNKGVSKPERLVPEPGRQS
ncbi:STAS domain-containing protein [Heliobacterium undosum]|uniref:STAS domain-containing protein n=1 Tax=Heliomicrobium undosum TaxID=121734 RepID=A0A845L630_9FIRM|nr:SulP family inorganic anion transporter [Heliomicrobium undosum]MZP29218.1 STAS domain-containing protein [Heliomicrobium undosum]